MVLNSRPLTYISADDLDEPLTPSHLMVGRRLMSFPDHLLTANCDIEDDVGYKLNNRVKYLNRSLESFWKRWRREYLLELREAHRHHRSSGEAQLAEGDVVVVFSEDQPRSCWKLGRIERVILGADGQIRAATVRVSKNGRTSTLDRPIQHLYPLEVVLRTVDDTSEQETERARDTTVEAESIPKQPNVHSSRPRRSAATQARDRILAQAMSEWEDRETL